MCFVYWGFDEWTTIATIFLSVVAIVIAIWSSHSTSKAAEKQIGKMEKQISEMQKQICEIKNLSALQIHHYQIGGGGNPEDNDEGQVGSSRVRGY